MTSTPSAQRSAPSGTPARPRNRRGQGALLREDLLDAARSLVVEAGDAGRLSLRALAARVGVAATSVYLHFDDIDAVKVALAQRCFVEFAESRDAAAAGVTEPGRALVVRCQAYADYAVAHPGEYRLMFSRDLPPLPSGGVEPTPNQAALDALVSSIARCQETGAAPDDTEPRPLALLVWTSLHGQVALRMDRPHMPWPPLAETIEDLVRRLVRLADPDRR